VLILPPNYRWESRKMAPNHWVSKKMQAWLFFSQFNSHALKYYTVWCFSGVCVCVCVYTCTCACACMHLHIFLYLAVHICISVLLCDSMPVVLCMWKCVCFRVGAHTQTPVHPDLLDFFLEISTSAFILYSHIGNSIISIFSWRG